MLWIVIGCGMAVMGLSMLGVSCWCWMAESPAGVPGVALVGLPRCMDFVVGIPGVPGIGLPRGILGAPGVLDAMGASLAAAAPTGAGAAG